LQYKSIAVIAEAYTKFAEAVMAAEASNKAAFSLKLDEINDFKANKDFPENTVDVCIAFNWLLMPNSQHSKFGNWNFSQGVMKDGNAFRKRLLTFRDDIMLNTDQYKEPFAKVSEIFEKHKENPVFTPDGMKSVSIVAAKILDYIFNINNYYKRIVEFKLLEEEKKDLNDAKVAKAHQAIVDLKGFTNKPY